MDVEEYLRTSFDGSDCDYLDGEVVGRNWGEIPHSTVQANLIGLLAGLRRDLKVRVLPEIRIRIHSRRYRVTDIAVWRDDNIGDRIPTVPPFLVVEVLSPEDRVFRLHTKIQEYLSIGVEWIWLVDPDERSALCYSRQNPSGIVCDVLRTENPVIEMPIDRAFNLDA